MKTKDKAKLKQSTPAELLKLRQDKTIALRQALAAVKSGSEKNLHAPTKLRAELAIINTFINQTQ